MRIAAVAISAFIAVGSLPALAQGPQQLLQGLLSGNQNQDQGLHEAYDRGYRRGREDQQRADNDRGPPPRGYPDNGAERDPRRYPSQQNAPYPR